MFTPAQALGKAAQWKALSSGSNDYFQTGTDIPTINEGSGGAYAAGSDFPPQGFDYQYQTPETVAGGPSFEIEPIDIDHPSIDAWLERGRNRPGYVAPPFDIDQINRNIQKMRKDYGFLRGV